MTTHPRPPRPSSRSPLRTLGVLAAVGALSLTAACSGTSSGERSESEREREKLVEQGLKAMPHAAVEKFMMMAGNDPEEAAEESREAATIAEQYAQARTAPGVVSAGAYGAAYSQLSALGVAGSSWYDVTRLPYDADDPRYRDYNSNSSGGAGFVTGRVTGLAVGTDGTVYAAAANGGVWRSASGTGGWVPIADQLPSESGGAVEVADDGSLWFASGEANTGGTSYAGSGVYRLADPSSSKSAFAPTDRVGGQELESTTIGRLRFGGGRVYAATNRGIWSHRADTADGAWTFHYAPNLAFMPRITDDAGNVLVPAGASCTDSTSCGPTNAGYKNIVNDIAVDPLDATHLVAAIGWRSGDTYNGFYESRDAATTWRKINPTGAMPANDIGYVTFGWAKDSSKLYAINQSPKLLNKATGTVNSYLDGVYVSKNGSIAGPWTKIADSQKLANSGSALKQSVGGKGYGPGIQAWYNQFLQVDPANPNHVYVGLEEVYETKSSGSTWTTPGPYWNFYFPCWDISDAKNSCSDTTHPDQHAAAIGTIKGVPTFLAGNDGGVYSRPVEGKADRDGHAADWSSLAKDGSLDALQYYSVAWGADKENGGLVISGGAQDNGVSNLFGVSPNGTASETRDGLQLRWRRWRRLRRPGGRLPPAAGVRQPVALGDRELCAQPGGAEPGDRVLAQRRPGRPVAAVHRAVRLRPVGPRLLDRRWTLRVDLGQGLGDQDRQGLDPGLRPRRRPLGHGRRDGPGCRLRRVVRTVQQRRLHPWAGHQRR